jgi:hypothetical protein
MGKTFGSGECKVKGGTRREVDLGLTAFVRNFEFYFPWGGGERKGSIR